MLGYTTFAACATGPAATPCLTAWGDPVDDPVLLASLPSAKDLLGWQGDLHVLEADGSLVVYSDEETERGPPVPDAVRLFQGGLVLDGGGGLWSYGRPVWFDGDRQSAKITAANPFTVAFEDGSTWFEAYVSGTWDGAERAWVEAHRTGIQLPGGATEVINGAGSGAALVDGDVWAWSHDDLDWDFFSPEPDQVLGWE